MDNVLSYEDLGSWDDLDAVSVTDDEEVEDPRNVDPRPTPPDIAEIDKSMADLEAELARLKLRKTQLLAERALVTRLPAELLSRIFELGVHENISLLSALSLVSRHWRSVALATPTLWTYIVLDNSWGAGRTPAFMRKLRVYLERSEACKLSIDIAMSYMDMEDLQDIMTELKPHLVRCFDFRLSAPCWDALALVRPYITTLGPDLEQLYMRVSASDMQEETPYCTMLAQSCPRLKTVMLEQLPLICVRVNLPQLRELCLMRDQQCRRAANRRFVVVFKELLSAIISTPTLEEIRLQSIALLLDGTEDIFQSAPTSTVIPALRSLSIHIVDASNISVLLESTSMPALQRLSVGMDATSDENMHWLSRISLASPTRLPALRQLDLRTCNIEGTALVPFIRALHQLPQLTALSLSTPRLGFIGLQIFDLLAAAPVSPGTWLLPRLEALCVQQCMDVTGHELLRVVYARHGPSVPDVADIKFLKVTRCDSFDSEVLEQLNAVVATVRVG